jgi:hypothetical protein
MLETLICVCVLLLFVGMNLVFYFLAGTTIKVWWRGNSDLGGLAVGVFMLVFSVTFSLILIRIATLPFP